MKKGPSGTSPNRLEVHGVDQIAFDLTRGPAWEDSFSSADVDPKTRKLLAGPLKTAEADGCPDDPEGSVSCGAPLSRRWECMERWFCPGWLRNRRGVSLPLQFTRTWRV